VLESAALAYMRRLLIGYIRYFLISSELKEVLSLIFNSSWSPI
jgi:hypothetical protein